MMNVQQTLPPKIVRTIPATVDTQKELKSIYRQLRVAAYCRVSTKQEDQLNSYEVQMRAYTEKINSEPKWTMVGIFADATVIIGLKQNPTNGRRFSPIFLLYRAFCGAKRRMPL